MIREIQTPQLLSTEQSIYSTNMTTTVIMNSTALLALLSIAHFCQLSSCETAASTLIDQSVKRAALLFRARERFSQVRANSTAQWDAGLQDHSNYSHRELAFICTHIAYLDMVSTANTTGQLLSGPPSEIIFHLGKSPVSLTKHFSVTGLRMYFIVVVQCYLWKQ